MRLTPILRAQLVFAGLLIGNNALAQSVFVAWNTQVWKIDPAGRIDRLEYDFGHGVRASMQGTTAPTISPDQAKIAFTRGNDLWVLDLSTMNAAQATKVGRPYTSRLASVFVLITSWSSDSRKILYRVEKGETEDPDSYAPERKMREAPYGDHIYDLDRGTSAAVFLPGEFLGWVPDGDFLVKKGNLRNARLMRVHSRNRNEQSVGAPPGDYGQVQIKPGGKQIVARRDSEIVLVDLGNGGTSRVANGTWAEFQAPAFSPSGNHLSYIRQFPLSTRWLVWT